MPTYWDSSLPEPRLKKSAISEMLTEIEISPEYKDQFELILSVRLSKKPLLANLSSGSGIIWYGINRYILVLPLEYMKYIREMKDTETVIFSFRKLKGFGIYGYALMAKPQSKR